MKQQTHKKVVVFVFLNRHNRFLLHNLLQLFNFSFFQCQQLKKCLAFSAFSFLPCLSITWYVSWKGVICSCTCIFGFWHWRCWHLFDIRIFSKYVTRVLIYIYHNCIYIRWRDIALRISRSEHVSQKGKLLVIFALWGMFVGSALACSSFRYFNVFFPKIVP